MKKYKVTFTGRLRNAIGITYKISDTIELHKNATFEEINIKLYDKYDHISNLKIHNHER